LPALPFTLRQLEIFASLCTTRSFRRSAEALGISQASVSNQIKVLEEQLGFELFDRMPGRRPLLRAEGAAFLDDLREFERAAEVLASHRRNVAEPNERPVRFRLLVGQGMFDTYMRRKLDHFFASHPNIELDFETHLPFGELIRAVESRQFDFALINHRADHPMRPEFRQLAIVAGGIYGHRKFAEGRQLPLDIDVLKSLPFILPNAGSKQERQVLRTYELHGVRPRHVIGHTQYYDVIAAMMERGLGVASFSSAILPAHMRDEVIMLYPLEDWRLLYYRDPGQCGPQADAVEQFIISGVVDDADYPALSRTV
jgi:DNA-binding transcriptional LysR family regulator